MIRNSGLHFAISNKSVRNTLHRSFFQCYIVFSVFRVADSGDEPCVPRWLPLRWQVSRFVQRLRVMHYLRDGSCLLMFVCPCLSVCPCPCPWPRGCRPVCFTVPYTPCISAAGWLCLAGQSPPSAQGLTILLPYYLAFTPKYLHIHEGCGNKVAKKKKEEKKLKGNVFACIAK